MQKPSIFTKILAIIGTILVWLPLLAPIFFSVISWIESHRFQLDYLMPAELLPVVLVGGGLLIWAAVRAKLRLKLIGGSIAAIAIILVAGAIYMNVSGLANGINEPVGILGVLALIFIIAYILALVSLGMGGVFLLRDLWTTR